MSRRRMLDRVACGFGSLALAGMSPSTQAATGQNPLSALNTHHPARAKRIIFLFMQGRPSHVDSFDYKPRLMQSH